MPNLPLLRHLDAKKKAQWGWVMYDWANSAFATTIMAAMLPVYYHKVAAADLPGYKATAYWGYTATVALLIVAIISPILGAIADQSRGKKRFLTMFALLGIAGTALLYLVRTGDWLKASLFYILGNVGFAAANVFYDALLPHIADEDEVDFVSTWGYAMGYLGGGLLLAVNLAMIMLAPEEKVGLMTRLSFLSVAVWWLVFTVPLWKWVPEPPGATTIPDAAGLSVVTRGFRQLVETFRHLRRYDEAFKFLLAFWLYNDGISTIIKMATIYGAEIGIESTDLIGTLLMVQFLGIPFSFLFGHLARRIGAKKGIYVSLVVYTLIAIGGYFMSKAWHFWLLGAAVATVQGGSQALSRSLFSRLIPKSKSAEFFGFFSVSAKFSGIVGPLLFGLVSQISRNSRLSIVALIVFFVLGMVLLARVDVEKGMAVVQADDAGMVQGVA